MDFNLVKKYISNPTDILDIGANTGGFFRSIKQVWPNANVLSIEANLYCEPTLKQVNPNYMMCVLDSEPRYRAFFLNRDCLLSTGSSLYKELTPHFNFDSTKCVKAKTETLDNILPYHKFDIVKLDTQGSELDIMIGGKKLMKRCKAAIIEVSHKPYNLNAPLSHTIVNYMLDNNFLLKETLATNSATHQSDYLFINEWWYDIYEQYWGDDENI